MVRILMGPTGDLHTGVHGSFCESPPPGFSYRLADATHAFAFRDVPSSPHRKFHVFEGIEFIDQRAEIVHSCRWPVLNCSGWVADTDDFGYPVLCGRHVTNPDFRKEFYGQWSEELKSQIMERVRAMLFAYAKDSCRAILFRSQFTLDDAVQWIRHIDAGPDGETFLRKCRVLYPAQVPCDPQTIERKWESDCELRIVFCGRDFETKGGEVALRTLRCLPSKLQANVVYIGAVPEHYKKEYEDVFLRIQYFQSLDHRSVINIFRDAHILLHPSRFESLGIVFLEASAAGMAVICAEGYGMPNLFELFERDGALTVDRCCPGSDEQEAFLFNLRFLLENPLRARTMGYANYQRTVAGKLSILERNKVLEPLYSDILRNPGEPIKLGELERRLGWSLTRMSTSDIWTDFSDYQRSLGEKITRFARW